MSHAQYMLPVTNAINGNGGGQPSQWAMGRNQNHGGWSDRTGDGCMGEHGYADGDGGWREWEWETSFLTQAVGVLGIDVMAALALRYR